MMPISNMEEDEELPADEEPEKMPISNMEEDEELPPDDLPAKEPISNFEEPPEELPEDSDESNADPAVPPVINNSNSLTPEEQDNQLNQNEQDMNEKLDDQHFTVTEGGVINVPADQEIANAPTKPKLSKSEKFKQEYDAAPLYVDGKKCIYEQGDNDLRILNCTVVRGTTCHLNKSVVHTFLLDTKNAYLSGCTDSKINLTINLLCSVSVKTSKKASSLNYKLGS